MQIEKKDNNYEYEKMTADFLLEKIETRKQ